MNTVCITTQIMKTSTPKISKGGKRRASTPLQKPGLTSPLFTDGSTPISVDAEVSVGL